MNSDGTTATELRRDASPEDRATLQAWFRDWEALIRATDMDGALDMFSPDVVGFGSSNRMLKSRTELHALQWSPTWPNIDDFTFLLDEFGCVVADDRLTATVFVPFASVGFDVETERPFERPGRCTIVLTRRAIQMGWRAVHTHFSLVPGTPLRTRRTCQDR